MGNKAAPASVRPFLERLAEGVVVFDGAMGTVLYSRGVFLNRCFDELNLSNPGLVRTIHDGDLGPGAARVPWDGKGDGGGHLANGVYFLRVEAGTQAWSGRVVLLR